MKNENIAYVVLIAIAIAILGWLWYSNHASRTAVHPQNPPPPYGEVSDIIDPLTIQLTSGHTVRYIGVRAPSVGNPIQCFGKEALLANESMLGERVRLEEEPLLSRSHDGAWTRYVWLIQGDEDSPEPTVEPDESLVEASNTPGIVDELADTVRDTIPIPTPDMSDDRESAENTSSIDTGDPRDIFVNERILEGGFAFPVVSKDMKYGERLLSAARFSSATGKGLWGSCEIQGEAPHTVTNEESTCVIKGKITNAGEKLYRTPSCTAYGETIVLMSEGEQWFCAEDTARDAGFTKAPDC